jgi:DNA-binding CsgD family transcriptional regulator/PAS domain-containing protein
MGPSLSSPDLEQFSRVVERIYDAAVDSTGWTEALASACSFVGGCSSNLFYHSTGGDTVNLFFSFNEDPAWTQLYREKYALMNPLFPASAFLEVGTVHSLTDVITVEEFTESRLYQEWVRPQGILDALYTNLERTATGAAAMSIRRHASDGLYGDDAKARLRVLVPHFQRAVTIGKLLDFHKANEASLAATIDRLATAVVLVAADGRIVHVNVKAEAMLAAGDILHAPDGRLTARNPRAAAALRDAIAASANGDGALGTKGIAVSLSPEAGSPVTARVLPLTSGERRRLLPRQAVAALFVHRQSAPVPAALEIAAMLYGLTPAEIRVLAVVAEAGSVDGMAAMLGISRATVKSHLERLFAKTGSRRQADLVKLLARHEIAAQL